MNAPNYIKFLIDLENDEMRKLEYRKYKGELTAIKKITDFYNSYKNQNSDMMLASIPYVVAVPYAVLTTKDQFIQNFEEKPTYTYYSNGGIYLMKFILKNKLVIGEYCNATDLMDILLQEQKNALTHYPILGYWLDIGKHSDYLKAQEDIKHINLY